MGAGWRWRRQALPQQCHWVVEFHVRLRAHNHQSLSSDIVDDAPFCELKLRGQSSCYWLEPSGSRHRLTFASKDFCAKFNEVFDEAKRLSRGGAG